MLFYLIRKDFLIGKKYIPLIIGVCLLMPLFVLWRTPEYPGVIGFALSVLFAVFMPMQYVSQKEFQYAKVLSVLCATPYSRQLMVVARYIFCISIYFVCCMIFWLETLVLPALGQLNLKLFALTFLASALFLGIYLPAQYKFGYEKTKFAYFIVIMATPLFLPYILKLKLSIFFDFFNSVSLVSLYGGITLFAVLILILSTFVSVHIFKKTDLI